MSKNFYLNHYYSLNNSLDLCMLLLSSTSFIVGNWKIMLLKQSNNLQFINMETEKQIKDTQVLNARVGM